MSSSPGKLTLRSPITDRRVHIAYPWRPAPWGGGNQFLQALRGELRRRQLYAEEPKEADAILFNSHHNLAGVLKLRLVYPKAVFVHRVDGPLALIRGGDWGLDRKIWRASAKIADAVVWQSKWSEAQSLAAGAKRPAVSAVILNAADGRYFYPGPGEREPSRLVAVSWSDNPGKGWDTYAWLSSRLSKLGWTLTVVGNCPVPLPESEVVVPLPSEKLGHLLREHDVFLTASRADPCSNALIEGLACGLPALARRDGGHPELVGSGGWLWSDQDELLAALKVIKGEYRSRRAQIVVPNIIQVTDQYLNLVERIPVPTRWSSYVGLA